MSEDDFKDWLANTDADITYVGEPIDNTRRSADPDTSLTKRANVMVTYYTKRTQNVCGGTCTVYNGGPTCLSAPGTSCLSATANVGFCDHGGCSGSCNEFASCGTRLNNNFCFTPGTKSIIVPFV